MTDSIKLTIPQTYLLCDLDEAPLWMLYKGESRPMAKLVALGFADKIGGEWKITKAGRAWYRANVVTAEGSPS